MALRAKAGRCMGRVSGILCRACRVGCSVSVRARGGWIVFTLHTSQVDLAGRSLLLNFKSVLGESSGDLVFAVW
eukprot:scaffold117969_cov19-Tisochrysis_lutea.AAC.1